MPELAQQKINFLIMAIKEKPKGNFRFKPARKPISDIRIAVIVSEWNTKITSSLLEACKSTLLANGILSENIVVEWVPGSFELPLAAKWLLDNDTVDSVICLGCVIKGETTHNHYISEAVSLNIAALSIEYSLPVIFGVLTTENEQQAVDRSGGSKGNKGEDAALAALKMLALSDRICRYI
jgi:6,7-dimethyl-8-ribityllumazine synthase